MQCLGYEVFHNETLQANEQLNKIQEMQNEIEKVQSKNQDCERQLNRCEEVLQDLTEKLAEKQKEVGNMITLVLFILKLVRYYDVCIQGPKSAH